VATDTPALTQFK